MASRRNLLILVLVVYALLIFWGVIMLEPTIIPLQREPYVPTHVPTPQGRDVSPSELFRATSYFTTEHYPPDEGTNKRYRRAVGPQD
jgi:hypothetical protein